MSSPSEPHILLAEDDPIAGSMMKRALEKHGFACTWVRDAADGVLALHGGEFAALVSDINMPGNIDLALVRHVVERRLELPIILLTGEPSMATAIAAVNLPVTAYLVKPVDLDGLLRLLRQKIGEADERQRLRAQREQLSESLRRLRVIEEAVAAGASNDDVRSALREIERSLASLVGPGGGAPTHEQQTLAEALREAIEVIESTQRAFRSRTLGQLRRKLEAVLAGGPVPQERIPPA